MNGGLLPILLLFATLGLALSLANRRAAWIALASLLASAGIVSLIPLPPALLEPVFVGLWFSIIATAVLVYFPRLSPDRWALPVAINAGAWAGALASLSGRHAGLVVALPLALLFLPGRWIVDHGHLVFLKVAASWMIAIAALSMFVSLTPTPGYKPDHME